MKDRVLKTGITAYFDTFAGLIKCRVTEVRDRKAKFTLSESRGAYKTGEQLESSTNWVIPAGALIRRKYTYTIGHYTVQEDT